MLKSILDLLPVESEVSSFVVDFESGLWKAIQSIYQDAVIHGCAFHWGQAVWRKVQENGLQVTIFFMLITLNWKKIYALYCDDLRYQELEMNIAVM